MRMIRRISSVAVALSLSLSAAVAGAQAAPGGFGSAGQFTIGAERLFGFVSSRQKSELEAGGQTTSDTDSFTRFTLLGLNGIPNVEQQGLTPDPYSVPRVGFDYFVIDKLSVGGSLMFLTQSGEHEEEDPGQTTTNDLPSSTLFVFAPRVGYALMFNDTIGFWPRGGFTYYNASTDVELAGATTEYSENGLAFSLEALFLIAPIPHFGFTVGPTLDLALTGGLETKPPAPAATTEEDRSITDIGIHAGVAVWF
jgi:hypothetical protein